MFATEQSLDQEFAVNTGKLVLCVHGEYQRTRAKKQISSEPWSAPNWANPSIRLPSRLGGRLEAPLAHPRQVAHQCVELVTRRIDDDRFPKYGMVSSF
jgi:hypothetical protein